KLAADGPGGGTEARSHGLFDVDPAARRRQPPSHTPTAATAPPPHLPREPPAGRPGPPHFAAQVRTRANHATGCQPRAPPDRVSRVRSVPSGFTVNTLPPATKVTTFPSGDHTGAGDTQHAVCPTLVSPVPSQRTTCTSMG